MKLAVNIICLMLGFLEISTAQLYSSETNAKYAIEEPSNTWILDLVDSLKTTTPLCDQCMSPPTFKRYEDKHGTVLYRLRYACSDYSSFIMIYDINGQPIAKCQINSEVNNCKDFEAYSNFTFSNNLLNIWSCKYGFNCAAKDSLGLFRDYTMVVTGSECEDKLRELSISTPFEGYEWEGASGKISQKSNIMVSQSDMYTISVTDQHGCVDSKEKQVDVYVEKTIPVDGDKILCPDEVTYLTSHGYESYSWSTGDSTDQIIVETSGIFTLTVTNVLGCKDSTSIDVQEITGRSVTILAGEELFYRDQVIPIQLELHGFEYNQVTDITWGSVGELTCNDCPSPYGKFEDDSEIFVMVTDEHDCVYEHSIVVEPEFAYKDVYAANVFSPDGDGDNDTFNIRSQNGAAIVHTFKVFNRWGVPIHDVGRHEINDPDKAWDGYYQGSLLETGVYVYMAEVEFIDGTRKYLTGDILLSR